MRLIKNFLILLIIFSNTGFGKDFKELFVIYEPLNDPASIEKSINSSFNTMVFRLSGSESPSNIWKIINAGNARKDFILSYSIKNFDEKSFLQVNFDKDALIEVFKELKIPVVGNSRPVVLILMKVDSGSMDPYFITSYEIKNSIDELIQNAIFNYSNSRGIFIELPDIDLTDRFDLLKYEKLIDSKDFISSKYLSDKVVTIDLTKVGLNNWSVTGDVNNQYSNDELYEDFFEDFESYIESEIDMLLSKNAVDITKEELIKIHINNINTLLDYKESRRIIENMVGTIQMKIISFDTDEIGFEVRMLGGFKTLEKQITENSFFEIIQGSLNDKYLRLEYKQ